MPIFSIIYALFCMAASMVPHSGRYMIPYAVMWENGLGDVQEADIAISSSPPPRQATWSTPTLPREEIKATTATPEMAGMYSVLVVVMMALALGILWTIGALVRMVQKTMNLNGATPMQESVIASLTHEVNLLKEQLAAASSGASVIRGQLFEARVKADQATAALTIERQSRRRAETREHDERRARLSTTANARATEREYRQSLEELTALHARKEAESQLRIENLMNEIERLKEANLDAKNHERDLEAQVRSLMASPQDAQASSGQIEDLSRARAEIQATHNSIQERHGNVRVFARIRPFLPGDNAPHDAEPVVVSTADGEGCILSKHVIDAGKDYGHFTHSFKFDKCFPPSAGQAEVFTEVSEFVQSALDGFNVCLFSYGSNGSGKIHTMQGSGAGSMRGIIPRAMEQVGKYKETLEEQGWQYQMEVSFLEIYNEKIKDLLRGDSSGQEIKHEIKRDGRGNTSVTEITKEQIDPNDSTLIDDIIQRAACRRSVARSDMNEHSSRSHSVFTLYLKAINNSQGSELRGTLHLVDLAGSERVGRSNANGDRLSETIAINTSLSALGSVFVAIANKNSHIPFRNSKLTYLLQPALSGSGKTLMMVNLSPAEESYRETLCSLRFAEQVKQCELGKPERNLNNTGSS